jgi:F0F1-type ATP synthase delta subunit
MILATIKTYLIKMLSEFLQLLHEDGRTEIYKGIKTQFRRFFSRSHGVTQ